MTIGENEDYVEVRQVLDEIKIAAIKKHGVFSDVVGFATFPDGFTFLYKNNLICIE